MNKLYIIFLLLFLKINSKSLTESLNIIKQNEYKQYDQKYLNFYTANTTNTVNNGTAIVVIAYNRPHYLKQVLDSLEKNPESKTFPFFFVLDNGEFAKQNENLEVIKNSKIKNKHIILRKCNYGCGKNIIDTRRFIFDHCKFDKAIIFEDDLVVSPQYIKLTLNLYNWAKNNFNNVGIIQCWYKYFIGNIEEKKKNLNVVQEPIENLWGYCIGKPVWDQIKDILYEYENLFLINNCYTKRNHKLIREWIKEKISKKIKKSLNNKISFRQTYNVDLFTRENSSTGQDAATLLALYVNGFVRLSTLVNRGIYIGKIGIHYKESLWYQAGHNRVTPDWFKEDQNITEFILKTI